MKVSILYHQNISLNLLFLFRFCLHVRGIKLAKNNCDNSPRSSSPAGAKKRTDLVMGGSALK